MFAATVTAATLCGIAPDLALAAGRPGDARPTGRSAGQASDPSVPPEPLIAVVSIADQHIEVFGPRGSVARSRVSTGKPGFDSPTGVFSILQRNRYHESNIYSNAPMPFMQRLTWSGIALHQGNVPNYRASHGCIRLPGGFAETMWGMGRIGMRVIVAPTGTSPVTFRHAKLPRPVYQSEGPSEQPALVRVAASTPTDAAATSPRTLSPYAAAQARLARATSAKAAADKAVKPALELATARSTDAQQASAAMRASAGILAEAEENLEFESLVMVNVQTEAAEEAVRARIRTAEAGVKAAAEALDKIKVMEAAASDAAFAAAHAARDAQQAAEAAADEVAAARKATSPLTVFVSRKTGQAYVRQGFAELYDGPVTISDADRPLGTHVYTAVEETGPDGELRWVAVSVPTSGGDVVQRRKSEASTHDRASTSAEALERIELPEEVRKLFAERLWPGASLIVSDFGLGETGKGTDFVIVTK